MIPTVAVGVQAYTENIFQVRRVDQGGDLEVVPAPDQDEQEDREDHDPEGDAEEGDVDVALGGRDEDAGAAAGPGRPGGGVATTAC